MAAASLPNRACGSCAGIAPQGFAARMCSTGADEGRVGGEFGRPASQKSRAGGGRSPRTGHIRDMTASGLATIWRVQHIVARKAGLAAQHGGDSPRVRVQQCRRAALRSPAMGGRSRNAAQRLRCTALCCATPLHAPQWVTGGWRPGWDERPFQYVHPAPGARTAVPGRAFHCV